MKALPTELQLVPTANSVLFTRNDLSDQRWGDLTRLHDFFDHKNFPGNNSDINHKDDKHDIPGLWGYADDKGIQLNGGRPGARWAPSMIRRFFYRLTPLQKGPSQKVSLAPSLSSAPEPSLVPSQNPQLYDFGDWQFMPQFEEMGDSRLHCFQKSIVPHLKTALRDRPMITLGGGHDFGAVDGEAFLQWASTDQNSKEKNSPLPLIINFDAHLDVRPWKNGLNSGTPFSWLLDHYASQFQFIEVGIQKQCASPQHIQWAETHGTQIIHRDELTLVPPQMALQQILAGTSPDQPCYVSFDIDVFSQALAPGCSQSWDGGLNYSEVMEALRWLFQNKNVRLLGIYEVSPPLDLDHRTSKLAACLMDEFLRSRRTLG